jgi:hypothetical protein
MHGRCLCGEVRFDATPAERHSHACHCEMCRRWTGGALLAVPVAPDAVRFEGEANIRRYRSSEWAERAFCGVCGSSLYYRVTAEGSEQGMYYMALGSFDEPDALPLASEIYVDVKPSAYAFAGEHRRITRAEKEASFGGGA